MKNKQISTQKTQLEITLEFNRKIEITNEELRKFLKQENPTEEQIIAKVEELNTKISTLMTQLNSEKRKTDPDIKWPSTGYATERDASETLRIYIVSNFNRKPFE